MGEAGEDEDFTVDDLKRLGVAGGDLDAEGLRGWIETGGQREAEGLAAELVVERVVQAGVGELAPGAAVGGERGGVRARVERGGNAAPFVDGERTGVGREAGGDGEIARDETRGDRVVRGVERDGEKVVGAGGDVGEGKGAVSGRGGFQRAEFADLRAVVGFVGLVDGGVFVFDLGLEAEGDGDAGGGGTVGEEEAAGREPVAGEG